MDLTAHGIEGPIVRHPHLAMSEMPRVQTEADIPFLPLVFQSPDPNLVRADAKLAQGIELIFGDAELCRRLTANTFERARTDFSISASRVAFTRLLGLNGAVRG